VLWGDWGGALLRDKKYAHEIHCMDVEGNIPIPIVQNSVLDMCRAGLSRVMHFHL
jgi:hypothetical protein